MQKIIFIYDNKKGSQNSLLGTQLHLKQLFEFETIILHSAIPSFFVKLIACILIPRILIPRILIPRILIPRILIPRILILRILILRIFFVKLFSLFFLSKTNKACVKNILINKEEILAVISCGNRSLAMSQFLKFHLKKSCFFHIQDPKIFYDSFEQIFIPSHDNKKGKNITSILGTVHAHNHCNKKGSLLNEDDDYLLNKEKELTKELALISFGGHTKFSLFFKIKYNILRFLLLKIINNHHIIISFSRRTPIKFQINIINFVLHNSKFSGKIIFIGINENICKNFSNKQLLHSLISDKEYLYYVKKCQKLFISDDSISMLSEAASYGKSNYLFNVFNIKTKHKYFRQQLIQRNSFHQCTYKAIENDFKKFNSTIINEANIVAKQIYKILKVNNNGKIN